jgi:hypothetical protein
MHGLASRRTGESVILVIEMPVSAPAISLLCDHPTLRAEIGAWLEGAQLPLESPLALHIDVGELPIVPHDERAVFQQGRVQIRGATSAQPSISMSWEPRLGHADIDATSASASVVLSEEGLLQGHELYRSFLLNVCILLLRKSGLHHVHGATLIDPRSRGWMFVGTSGSGKSTTSALLARQGWSVGTDDIAFLARNEIARCVEAFSWRERMALRRDSVSALGVTGGLSFGTRKKTGWLPEDLGTTWAPSVVPEILAFTGLSSSSETTARRITARDALERLMHNSAWVMLDASVADEHLRLLTALATQVRAYELHLGRDLFDHSERLLEVIT